MTGSMRQRQGIVILSAGVPLLHAGVEWIRGSTAAEGSFLREQTADPSTAFGRSRALTPLRMTIQIGVLRRAPCAVRRAQY
jgi:hypothetical protein